MVYKFVIHMLPGTARGGVADTGPAAAAETCLRGMAPAHLLAFPVLGRAVCTGPQTLTRVRASHMFLCALLPGHK